MQGHGRYRSIVAVTLTALLLGACASAVKESDRDTSGRFDGRWIGSVEEGIPSSVRSGNWQKKCTSGDWRFGFVVDDGTISLPSNGEADASSAFVDSSGAFRLVVPRGSREVTSRESGSVGASSLSWIFAGRLDEERTVRFTVGDSKYGGAGCWWNLDLQRI